MRGTAAERGTVAERGTAAKTKGNAVKERAVNKIERRRRRRDAVVAKAGNVASIVEGVAARSAGTGNAQIHHWPWVLAEIETSTHSNRVPRLLGEDDPASFNST